MKVTQDAYEENAEEGKVGSSPLAVKKGKNRYAIFQITFKKRTRELVSDASDAWLQAVTDSFYVFNCNLKSSLPASRYTMATLFL
jgi:hypothetical protein